jgi:hypothetical protein
MSFSMFSGKLLSETWRALERSKLARPTISEGFNAFATQKSLGLTVMAILADSCAGTQKALTTDRAESHSALTRWITLTKGGEFKAGAYKKDAEDYKRLVSISLKVIDSRRYELRNLISLRQREEREGGHSLRDLRHRYATKINEYTDKLATQARTQGDKAEIERRFEQEMKDEKIQSFPRLGGLHHRYAVAA